MNILNRFRLLKIFLLLVKNPTRTDLIFQAVDILSHAPDQGPIQEIERQALAHSTFKAMYEARYVPEIPSRQRLDALPVGTFGHALRQYLDENGLSLDLFPTVDADRAIDYLSARIYREHDLWHALLGYGVTVEDELALQAFGVAQYRSPLGTMLVAGGLIHLLLRDPMRAVEALRRIAIGYHLGANARFLLELRLHDLFDRPLEEVRRMAGLNLEPVTSQAEQVLLA